MTDCLPVSVFYFSTLPFPDDGMAAGNRIYHLASALALAGDRVFVLSLFSDSGVAECMRIGNVVSVLGMYGILGFGSMLLMMCYAMSKVKKLLQPLPKLIYNIAAVALLVLLVIKSESLREQLCFMFLVIPAILISLRESWFFHASMVSRKLFRIPYYRFPGGRA